MLDLFSNYSFKELHSSEGLLRLDKAFLAHLGECDEDLKRRLLNTREQGHPASRLEESALLLDLAPYIEDFLGKFFGIEKEIASLQEQTHQLAPLYRCKRLFVQRMASKAYTKDEALVFDGEVLKDKLSQLMNEPYSDLTFARHVLRAIDALDNLTPNTSSSLRGGPQARRSNPGKQHFSGLLRSKAPRNDEIENIYPTVRESTNFLELSKKYAAWAIHQPNPTPLFRLPRKIKPEALIPLTKEKGSLKSPHFVDRKGFDCTTPPLKSDEALDQAHYCILCHNQNKDSCSKGLSENQQGCPLDQKISEMNTLHRQGNTVAALAMIMVDNPMVAATGHRICNECKKGCIFQKQDAVDVPMIETHILDQVLGLPWGVEIYSLLSRWNPLNIKSPYPKPLSGYKVLVAGMGPAGFTLAHYLLNEGHTVVGIDGLKIEPLEKEFLTVPIRQWASLNAPLSERKIAGFGGVAEYGITSRWNKNYLTLIRILLERRSHFALYDGVRLGGTLTLDQAFQLGFDHIALCLGAGQPHTLDIPKASARGVRLASDFLMALQLTGAAQEKSLANLQLRLPILVVGGGLTAVDTATEALAYYAVQVEKFLQRIEELGGIPPSLSEEETHIAEEFMAHAKTLRQGDRSFLEQACHIVYRKRIEDSPAYRLNAEELDLALRQGVKFIEETTPLEMKVDAYGQIEGLTVQRGQDTQILSCRTLLIATGTQPNTVLEEEDSYIKIRTPKNPELLRFAHNDETTVIASPERAKQSRKSEEDFLIPFKGNQNISHFGDLNSTYHGNVVKAMASAKEGYPHICRTLLKSPHSPTPDFFKTLDFLLCPRIERLHKLTPTIWEIVVHAPQAARNFKPGQFFRLQNYGTLEMEGLALTGAHVDAEKGLLSLIVLEMGGSSTLCQYLKEEEQVVLMGPSGTATEIPHKETVLLIGGGLGNAVLFSIGKALKENGCRVIYVAGYKSPENRFKVEDIESIADHVIWCFESLPTAIVKRPQDYVYEGNVIEGLLAYADSSPPLPLNEVDRIITIGSDQMMAAVACARKTLLKPYLNPEHQAIGSINSPMQCMMKGICGQCIQTLKDPETGKTQVIFTCAAQDQALDHVDFEVLKGRLHQNSLLEKQTHQWIRRMNHGT